MRELAGEIVMREIALIPGPLAEKQRRFLATSGISKPTLYNVRSGKGTVSASTYWAIAGALRLPTQFFDFVIAGDAQRIKRLPGRDVDPAFGLREDLRQYVLDRIGQLAAPRGRRSTDRSA